MTATFEFDRLLESVLDADGPQTAPPTLVEAALTQSRALKQRRPRVPAMDGRAWPAHRLSPWVRPAQVSPRLWRVLLLTLIATAAVALAVVGSALLREDPMIKGFESTFIRPFEYRIPVESGLRVTGDPDRSIVAWTLGPDDWPHPSEEVDNGRQHPQSGQVRGVVVGLGEPAVTHASAGRITLPAAPGAFLTELRDRSGVRMDSIVQTTFDGRPAAMAQLPGVGGSDIHAGPEGGLAGPFVRVTYPSRLIVTEVDGKTIFILLWARNARELDAWLPIADEFVASIHFLP